VSTPRLRGDDPPSPPRPAGTVVLIGPPGAGKSSAGALLARRLGVAFTDTDRAVERLAGKPVGDVFVEDGESVFRELERAAVARCLDDGGGVVALGSGAVLDPDVRRQISSGCTVVYLDASFATVAKRTGMDRPRIVIPGNPRAMLRRMLEERQPVYESLATVTVPADELSPEELADQIAGQLA
jgi:shikimate kinase